MTLQHVALETARDTVAAEITFFSLLGFTPVDPPATLRDRATWLQAGATQLHLLYAETPRAAGHIAVVVADFATTLAALEAAGHRTEERTPHWGAARVYVRSPGGHLVEVMAAAPPAAPSPR